MDTIELECPGCAYLLDLDRGFAGGVCRCSNCGTLMTVPADPTSEQAKRLVRAERPGGRPEAPAARPDTPGSRPDAPPPSPAAAPPAPPQTTGPTVGISSAPSGYVPSPAVTSTGVETFVTDDGQVVEVNQKRIVTVSARKRALIRGATAVIFVCAVAILAIGAIAGAVAFMMSYEDDPNKAVIDQNVGYDPDDNPFEAKDANVLGIQLGDRTAVAIDTSNFSTTKQWMPIVQQALRQTVDKLGASRKLQLALFRDGRPKLYPGNMSNWSQQDRDGVGEFFARTMLVGVADPVPAIEALLPGEPDVIVLITGQAFEPNVRNAIVTKLAGRRAKLHIVTFGSQHESMENLADDSGGAYRNILIDDLKRWAEEANLVK